RSAACYKPSRVSGITVRLKRASRRMTQALNPLPRTTDFAESHERGKLTEVPPCAPARAKSATRVSTDEQDTDPQQDELTAAWGLSTCGPCPIARQGQGPCPAGGVTAIAIAVAAVPKPTSTVRCGLLRN